MSQLALKRPPEARAETVEDLVLLTHRGKIRVPPFQRGLKWGPQQVLDLFDSVYRGLPIGSLLLQRREAPAAHLGFGPLTIDAPAFADALWVIDGQQRLTSLAASLARPVPIPVAPIDPFVVYFDPRNQQFKAPSRHGATPEEWVPVPLLLDATRLGEWILDWAPKTDKELTRRVFEAGKRVREYRVPLYIVDTEDADVLKEIFFRVNNTGKTLKWFEVYDALYGHDGAVPSTLSQLTDELSSMGMGKVEPSELTSCLLALRGLDVTRTLAEHRRKDPDVLRGAVADALPVLKQVLAFLRSRCAIPHLRCLPRTLVLEVLTRFFALHSEPNPRTLELLSRWVWRALLGSKAYDERTLRRRGVAVIGDDEEVSAQELISLVPRERQEVEIPDSFDARAAGTRLALLAIASLAPRHLVTGEHVDVAALIEADDVAAFRSILRPKSTGTELARAPANRMIHPRVPNTRELIIRRLSENDEDVLGSHGITIRAASLLKADDRAGFLSQRNTELRDALQRLGGAMAGWNRRDRDRPSLSFLLRKVRDAG